MQLKPQDTLLALKYWSQRKAGHYYGVRALAEAIGISAGEVSKATRRLMDSRLIVEREGEIYAESGALLEWLCYGVRYAYPAHQIGYGRGMPTAWNCPKVKSSMIPPSPALVWPQAGGKEEGIWMQPIHEAVPFAASKDDFLYQALALLDAIRAGKPRELAIAREQLQELIRSGYA